MLSSLRRRLYSSDGQSRDVDLAAGTAGWLPAQRHAGHNIGDSDTHVLIVEPEHGVPDAGNSLGLMLPTGGR